MNHRVRVLQDAIFFFLRRSTSLVCGTLLQVAVANGASDRIFADGLVFNQVLSELDEASGAIWNLWNF